MTTTSPLSSFAWIAVLAGAAPRHQDYFKRSAPRYQAYLKRSGREEFLRKAWGPAAAAK